MVTCEFHHTELGARINGYCTNTTPDIYRLADFNGIRLVGHFPSTLLGVRGAIRNIIEQSDRALLPLDSPGQPAHTADNEPTAAAPSPIRRHRLQHPADTVISTLLAGDLLWH